MSTQDTRSQASVETPVRAVNPVVPRHFLEWRKEIRADRWDEMWEGVLHTAPAPNRLHQDLEWQLETYLRLRWAKRYGSRVYHQINLAAPGGWRSNYRVSDLVLLLPDRFHIDHNEYFEGAPTAVVEIHSPGDEAFDKMPFYAALGVPEVWIIDCDTRRPEIHLLAASGYEPQPTDAAGWIRGAITGIELRATPGAALAIRLIEDPTTEEELLAE